MSNNGHTSKSAARKQYGIP